MKPENEHGGARGGGKTAKEDTGRGGVRGGGGNVVSHKPAKVSGSLMKSAVEGVGVAKPERKKYNVFETMPVQRRKGPAPRKQGGTLIHISKGARKVGDGWQGFSRTFKKSDKDKKDLKIIQGKPPEVTEKEKEEVRNSVNQKGSAKEPAKKETCDVDDCDEPAKSGLCESHDDPDW